MKASPYQRACLLMMVHAILVIIWNIAGIWLISQGKSALGPTATWAGVVLFAVLMGIYFVTCQKGLHKTFLVFALLGSLLGLSAIYGAFTKDPALWPSEFWRFAGVAVNFLGIAGFALGLKNFFKEKS